jgi:hypothetical protein
MKKSIWGLTALIVAGGVLIWSASIQARPNNARLVNQGTLAESMRTPGGINASTYTGPTAESTGFEAAEGWNLGGMCDDLTFSACGAPPIAASCTGNPIVDQNCCNNNPNPYTGWYMSGSSQHCAEPHIDTANPATGEQHMRFTRDATHGNPAGCIGLGTACRVNAFTPPLVGPLPVGPTTLSFNIAMGGAVMTPPYGSVIAMFTVSDSSANQYNAQFYFDYYGIWQVYDAGMGAYVGVSYMTGGGVYDAIRNEMNPCTNTIDYYINDVPVWSQSAGFSGLAQYIERNIFQMNNDVYDWDLDDYVMYRAGECPHECGNDIIEATEECDGIEDDYCPGRCIPLGQVGECTCARDGMDCATATEVFNGTNGPFLTHGGFFKYTADSPWTSINTCASQMDNEMWWDWDPDCLTYMDENDDCTSGDDPTAPCADQGSGIGSCLCVATEPGRTYVFAVGAWDNILPPPLGSNIVIDITKKLTCGQPIPNGACCDGETGICTDNVEEGQCACEQCTWTENKLCSMVECARHTGACCDGTPGLGGACTDGTYPEDCACEWCTWTKGALCDTVTCDEVMGACCQGLIGYCSMTLEAACVGEQFTWTKGATCAEVTCVAAQGACCNHDDGSCTQTTQAACDCEKCDWTKGADCAAVECLANFLPIPTVSEWGLAILALLLLTGAKVYFGRRQVTA